MRNRLTDARFDKALQDFDFNDFYMREFWTDDISDEVKEIQSRKLKKNHTYKDEIKEILNKYDNKTTPECLSEIRAYFMSLKQRYIAVWESDYIYDEKESKKIDDLWALTYKHGDIDYVPRSKIPYYAERCGMSIKDYIYLLESLGFVHHEKKDYITVKKPRLHVFDTIDKASIWIYLQVLKRENTFNDSSKKKKKSGNKYHPEDSVIKSNLRKCLKGDRSSVYEFIVREI